MPKELPLTNRGTSFYVLSVLLHCVTISSCLYLTVRLVNVQSELSAVKDEVQRLKTAAFGGSKKSTGAAISVNVGGENHKKFEVSLQFLPF